MKYLNNKLIQFNHKIKKLDVSFLYNKNILDQISNLKLSLIVKISLVKLNLSYCGLNDTTTCKFLQNNCGLLNLKKLNLSNNLFLNNNKKNAGDYRKYLNNKLIQFNHKLKKLDVSFLYNKKIIDQLNGLKLSPMIKISLIKLNLSYCGLNDTTATNFFQNNFGLLNLKELNLSNNFITLEILDLFIKNEIPFDNLYSLDLSMNTIDSVKIENYKQIDLFTQINPKLKKIKFQGTKFSQELLMFKVNGNSKEEFEEITQNLCNKGVKFVVENEHKVFITPMEKSFETKDKEKDTF
jgi:hypothetical protein